MTEHKTLQRIKEEIKQAMQTEMFRESGGFYVVTLEDMASLIVLIEKLNLELSFHMLKNLNMTTK